MSYYPSLNHITIDGDNAFSVNFAGDLQYLLKLEPERMLYNFKSAFGVETSAEPIYGWDAPDGLLRGHSTGHFLSALAIAYSATGDVRFKEKLSYTVGELRKLQLMSKGEPESFVTACTPEDCSQDKWSRDPSVWGDGFLSAYSPDQFALLEQFTPYAKIWAPYYTLHKILAGLIEAYERCGLEEALAAAEGIGGWVFRRLSVLTPEHRAKMWSMYIAGEFGGMNESLARLALLTGKREFMDCARMFDNANIFPGLEEGEDVIKRLHANQHIPQIMGAVMEYRATGEVKYLKIAKNFFDIVKNHHMYAIGGVGQGECFREPDELAHFIKGDTNCETCATYNLIKLARELYALSLPISETTAAGYMDYIERGLYNHILASRNPEITEDMTNGVTYMLPIGPGAEKSYTDDYYSFTCCHGTGMENHVKYGDCLYYVGSGAVYVNEYVPSTLSEGDLVIRQELEFPSLEGRIVVKSAVPVTVKLRIPAWAGGNPFSVNGKSVEVDGRYAIVEAGGEVDSETVVNVNFNFRTRLEYLPDMLSEYDEYMVNRDTHYHDDESMKADEDYVKSLSREAKDRVAALMYGPFVMCARCGGSEFLRIPADTSFISAVDGSMVLYGAGVAFVPIYILHGEPYHAYFVAEKASQSVEKTLDMMMEESEKMFPCIIGLKGRYFRILDYLFDNQDYILTPAQINYLLDHCRPPLRQSGETCFPLLAQVLRSAEAANDLSLICKVYTDGIYFYENHEYNEKKIEILKGGVDYFLSRHAEQYAGEVCLKIAESQWVDKDLRMSSCADAVKYLAENTEQYEQAAALMKNLSENR